jgi:hypothetical protein
VLKSCSAIASLPLVPWQQSQPFENAKKSVPYADSLLRLSVSLARLKCSRRSLEEVPDGLPVVVYLFGLNPKNETVSYDTLAGKETASGKETIYEGVP